MYKTLVVEDNAVFRYAVRTIVDWAGCGFELAAEAVNGKHALKLMEARRFDFILTDVSMPEMNGIDLLRTVKRRSPDTVIVMLSSYDDFRFVKDSMKIGAEDYLLKHDLEPEGMRRMLEQVKQVLDGQREGRRSRFSDGARAEPDSAAEAEGESAAGTDRGGVSDGAQAAARDAARDQARAGDRISVRDGVADGARSASPNTARDDSRNAARSESACRRKEIRQAIAYIQAHFAEDISTAELARRFGFSVNYMSNLFRSETGYRIKEFVNRERVAQARRLLKETNLKTYEVADLVGFQDSSYFCKVFKEITGTTVSTERNS